MPVRALGSGDSISVKVVSSSNHISARERHSTVVARGGVTTQYEAFEGPYEVIPSPNEFTLATEKRYMLSDMTIDAIPYASVSNIYGGHTVTIGEVYDG